MKDGATNTPAGAPQEPVANTDWAALLSDKDIASLAGFFDVLIQMDLEQKRRNERRENENTSKDSASGQSPTA